MTKQTASKQMTISVLMALCQKAFDKYGDLPVGAYDLDYAMEISTLDLLRPMTPRVITPADAFMPGEEITLEDQKEKVSSEPKFLVFLS